MLLLLLSEWLDAREESRLETLGRLPAGDIEDVAEVGDARGTRGVRGVRGVMGVWITDGVAGGVVADGTAGGAVDGGAVRACDPILLDIKDNLDPGWERRLPRPDRIPEGAGTALPMLKAAGVCTEGIECC